MFRKCINGISFMLLCSMLLISILPMQVQADIGPKETLNIEFSNMGDELCYGTLFTPYEGVPLSAGSAVFDDPDLEEKVTATFSNFVDSDGYVYRDCIWDVSQHKSITWGYMPPEHFRIVLYYPESDTIVTSPAMEKDGFHSYYTVDMDGVEIAAIEYNDDLSTGGGEFTENYLQAQRKSSFWGDIFSFLARVICTIIIEMAIAWFFGFKEKKQLYFLTIVNVITQIVLNVLLDSSFNFFILFGAGLVEYIIIYVFYELIVFLLEAIMYCIFMNRMSILRRKIGIYILYALTANAVSFGAGIVLVQILPGMF